MSRAIAPRNQDDIQRAMPVRLASCGVFLVFRRHFLVFVFSCHLLFLRGRGGWLFSGCTGFVSIKSWWWLGAETCTLVPDLGLGLGLDWGCEPAFVLCSSSS